MSFIRKKLSQFKQDRQEKAQVRSAANLEARKEYQKRYREHYRRVAVAEARKRAKADAERKSRGFSGVAKRLQSEMGEIGGYMQNVTQRNAEFWGVAPSVSPQSKPAIKKGTGKTITIRVVGAAQKKAKPKPQEKKRDINDFRDWI